ncbi:MAG: hypothetical protein ACAH95_17510 [Fimbriimonas sp.]
MKRPQEDPAEVKRILGSLKAPREDTPIEWEVGDKIRVTEGPFENIKGVVSVVIPDQHWLTALLNIFGRDTPVELNFGQVERL